MMLRGRWQEAEVRGSGGKREGGRRRPGYEGARAPSGRCCAIIMSCSLESFDGFAHLHAL